VIVHRPEPADIEVNASRRTLSLFERRLLLFADGQCGIDEISTRD